MDQGWQLLGFFPLRNVGTSLGLILQQVFSEIEFIFENNIPKIFKTYFKFIILSASCLTFRIVWNSHITDDHIALNIDEIRILNFIYKMIQFYCCFTWKLNVWVWNRSSRSSRGRSDVYLGLARTYPHFFTKTDFFHFWPQNRFEVKKKEFWINFWFYSVIFTLRPFKVEVIIFHTSL